MPYGSTTMADQPPRASTVEFDHVTKRYDAGTKNIPGAVNDLSLQVPAGKICVLVGPSGCGKTTSLKMVNRLIEPTSGRILIDGDDIAKRDVIDLRRSIGYVAAMSAFRRDMKIQSGITIRAAPRSPSAA